MAINPNFPDWYRSAGLSPDAALMEARWAAVEELTTKPTLTLVTELARLFTVPTSQETPEIAAFRETFKKHDAVFPARNNLQELRVLAGAILRALIDGNHDVAPLAALSMVCGSFGPRVAAVPVPDHLNAAETFLVNDAKASRTSEKLIPITVPAGLKAKISKALPDTAFQSAPTIRDPLVALLGEVCGGLLAVADQAQRSISALEHVAAVRQEEVGVLWWLHSRFSSSVERPFSEVGYLTATLLFPLELANLTSFVPGPEYLPAVLVRSLQEAGAPSNSEPVTLSVATNALERGLRERIATRREHRVPHDLTPILFAISKSLETDGPEDWFPVFRKACDVPLDRPFPLVSLSLQLYRELMLTKASSASK